MHELVKELAENYKPDAEAKHLELKTEIDPKLELLHSSKLYVREILQNFITNAIKYTAKGTVTIDAKADPKGVIFAFQIPVSASVRPTRSGFLINFSAPKTYRTRQANGTGLGLYVTMKLARLLHAEIKLESELNQGSTFTIFVPNLA